MVRMKRLCVTITSRSTKVQKNVASIDEERAKVEVSDKSKGLNDCGEEAISAGSHLLLYWMLPTLVRKYDKVGRCLVVKPILCV